MTSSLLVTVSSPPASAQVILPTERGSAALRASIDFRQLPRASVEPLTSPLSSISFPAAIDRIEVMNPPDTMGAVGPADIVTTLNQYIIVQSRSGVRRAAVRREDFWAPFATNRLLGLGLSVPLRLPPLTSPDNPGIDPRVEFDSSAGRWVYTALGYRSAAPFGLLMAVSRGFDPQGIWDLFLFPSECALDIPRTAINGKWVVVSANKACGRADVWAFDKADLYAGGAGNYARFRDAAFGIFLGAPARPLSSERDQLYFAAVGRLSSPGCRSGLSCLVVHTLDGPIGNERLELASAGMNLGEVVLDIGSEPQTAPQRGTAQRINNQGLVVGDLLYRDGSLWMAHTIRRPNQNPSRSAIGWYQFTPEGTLIQRGRIEDSRILTDETQRRFYGWPSLTVNRDRSMVIGYSVFAADQYAGAGYRARRATDPRGRLPLCERFRQGQGPVDFPGAAAGIRWGDYSATVLDPRDDRTIWTVQEYAATESRVGVWWHRVNLLRSGCTP